MSPILLGDITALGTLSNNTSGTAAGFTSITQNSQFNSIGVGVVPSGAAGQINATGNIVTTAAAIVSTGVTFASGTTQTNAAIGYGQTWSDVTAGRTWSTTYTNATSRSIQLSICLQFSGAVSIALTVNGATAVFYPSPGYNTGISNIIPPGATYNLTRTTGGANIVGWYELS
jgi:hypothetical protein